MKKSQMLRVLLWTIAGLAIFVPACIVSSKLLAYSTQKDDSYKNLLVNIEKIAIESGSVLSQTMRIDKGTAILGYPMDSKIITIDAKCDGKPLRSGRGEHVSSFEKPSECEDGKSCICLCQKFESRCEPGFGCNLFSCTSAECKSYSDFNLIGTCKIDTDGGACYECSGGFYIGREGGRTLDDLPEKRFVRIENTKGSVAVCENPDPVSGCVPP